MKTRGHVMSEDKIKGFIKVEEFKGQSTIIDLGALKQLVKFLEVLKIMGFREVEIGVENGAPLLLFLDKDKTTAFGIAPLHKEE